MIMLVLYITNRYSAQKEMIRIDNLKKELSDARNRATSRSSQLLQLSRESKVAEFTAGKPCTVSFWALNGASAAGTVRETAPMADPVSRTYKVRVSVPNPPQGMALGMTANVSFEDGSAPAERSVLLPMLAIYQTGDSPQVWAVDAENRVHLKNVSVEKEVVFRFG